MMVPPPSAPGPGSDENVSASEATAMMSAWVLTTQKPTPSGVCRSGRCHHTGASRRSRVKTLVGEAARRTGRDR